MHWLGETEPKNWELKFIQQMDITVTVKYW